MAGADPYKELEWVMSPPEEACSHIGLLTTSEGTRDFQSGSDELR